MDCELGPPLKIHKEIIDECFDKANSRPNLAVQLVKRVYSKNERGSQTVLEIIAMGRGNCLQTEC